MTPVPWWGLASSAAAPVLLIGGWTLAAERQRGGFDSAVETISALAAQGADDRWLMAAALAGLGVCHVVTAAALRDAAPLGRAVLAAGGLATVVVAAVPLPADDTGSAVHTAAAGFSFLALAVWPAASWRRDARSPFSPGVSIAAATVLLGLVGWFGAELTADSDRVGVSERIAAGAQSLWPAAVAWGSMRRRR
ncbi:MAG: DUF998 domain-containing protein [Actinomycetes bacterium]